ncbi:10479_t:CDS:2 [Gigaspora margarita]|uniref:10479_t:CDS:1 n=1 Tax=Gigaspora margarita TaxID=4874 RepID=A0ABM8VWN6_GIGMA|nr:10479_t:CDS:2 [Gigaspora margarita]
MAGLRSNMIENLVDRARKNCPWKTGRYVDFLGKEKGKSYNLSIPENHPVLFLKPRDKKERFYWIEGAENIPIEKNPPGYLGSDDNNGNNYHK